MLLSRYLFHGGIAVALAVLIMGLLRPATLSLPWFWASFGATCVGFLGIGTLLVSIARTQAAASLLAFCYLLAIGFVLFLASQSSAFAPVLLVMFEQYGFLYTFLAMGPEAEAMPVESVARGLVSQWILVSIVQLFAAWVFLRRGWR